MRMFALIITALFMSGCVMADKLASGGPDVNRAMMQLGYQLMEYGKPTPAPARQSFNCTALDLGGNLSTINCY